MNISSLTLARSSSPTVILYFLRPQKLDVRSDQRFFIAATTLKGCKYLRVLNLLLQLLNHVFFVVALHSAQIDMPLNLRVILLALLNLALLLADLELHLLVL